MTTFKYISDIVSGANAEFASHLAFKNANKFNSFSIYLAAIGKFESSGFYVLIKTIFQNKLKTSVKTTRKTLLLFHNYKS